MNDLKAQTKMLLSMLTSLVKGMNRLHEIEGGLRELGTIAETMIEAAGD